jgi:hypothetical protein
MKATPLFLLLLTLGLSQAYAQLNIDVVEASPEQLQNITGE